jgi:hypothetical protein
VFSPQPLVLSLEWQVMTEGELPPQALMRIAPNASVAAVRTAKPARLRMLLRVISGSFRSRGDCIASMTRASSGGLAGTITVAQQLSNNVNGVWQQDPDEGAITPREAECPAHGVPVRALAGRSWSSLERVAKA